MNPNQSEIIAMVQKYRPSTENNGNEGPTEGGFVVVFLLLQSEHFRTQEYFVRPESIPTL